MSTDPDDLSAVQEAVIEHARNLDIVHYPAALSIGGSPVPVAIWNDDADWRGFLDFAPTIGAAVIYANLELLAEDDIPDDANESQASALAEHFGQPVRLMVAYCAGGVVHLWMREASWWEGVEDDLAERDELDRRALLDQTDALMKRATHQDWAATIAKDRRFYPAVRGRERFSACQAIVVELLGEEAVTVDERSVSRVSNLLYDAALSHVEQVRAEVEERALADVPDMVAQLAAENPEWPTWGFRLRQQKAKRLVTDRYGYNIPGVTAEVARR